MYSDKILKVINANHIGDKAILKTIFDNEQIFIAFLDKDGSILAINNHFEEMIGYRSEELKEKKLYDNFLFKSTHFENILDSEFSERLYVLICKNGEERALKVDSYTIEKNPRVDLVIGVDVTIEYNVKKRDFHFEKLLQALLRIMPRNLYTFELIYEKQYRIKRIESITSEEGQNTFSYSLKEWLEKIHPEDCQKVENAFLGVQVGSSIEIEYRLKDEELGWSWHREISYATEMREGELILHGLSLDITEKKHFNEIVESVLKKEQFRMEECKLAAMGELMSSIAHHWRQPLNTVALTCDIIHDYIIEGDMKKEDVISFMSEAKNAIRQLSNLISGFGKFGSSLEVRTPRLFSIKESLERSVDFFASNNPDIEVIVEAAEDGEIFGAPIEMSMVFLSLFNNALDATRNNKNSKWVKAKIEREREEVIKITVEDNGNGIDDDIVGRIFEPYFSTKFPSLGTGMGLYAAKTIIESHFSGKIEVQKFKNGASFAIILKSADTQKSEAEMAGSALLHEEMLMLSREMRWPQKG